MALAGVAECRDHRIEFFSSHARSRRTDGEDATGAGAAHAAVVLSREEAARLIAAARNLKAQTALSVAYGTGLRASECGGAEGHRHRQPAH